ncbi:MAG: UPF0182 family protein [Longimicrobiales bacterium]
MLKRPVRLLAYAGLTLLVLLIVSRSVIGLYTDALWFSAVGYSDVFRTRLLAGLTLRTVASVIGAAIVLVNLARVVRHLGPVQLRRRYGNLEIAEVVPRSYVRTGIIVAAALAGWWLSGISFRPGAGISALAVLRAVPWGESDPLFGRDLSFYVFSLPFYSRLLDFLLLVVVWSAMLTLVGYVLVGAVRVRNSRLEVEERPRSHFAMLVASLVLLFGVRYWLGRYGVLLDGSGYGGGIGYTDVHARLPAYRALAILAVVSAAALLWGAARRTWVPAVAALGLLMLTGLGLGIAYPAIIQKIRVVPNQLDREAAYIAWHIEYTRKAFGLTALDEQAIDTRAGRAPQWAEAAPVLERVPLWDAEPLQVSLNALESSYPYYHFPSVHFDRYGAGDSIIQVAIGVREFTQAGLTEDARNWRTLHLDTTIVRGNGLVMTPAARKTDVGDPVFWVRGVPTTVTGLAPPGMRVNQPAIYFGETSSNYVIVSAPPGEDSATAARTGIPVGSFLRRALFAWQMRDRNLFFTGELTPSSRLLRLRSLNDRLTTLAPFIYWDRAPYPVLHEGRIIWYVDGYTVSASYPISRPFPLPGLGPVRYVRNSVKATINALTGEVTLYAVEPEEPLMATYARAFPGLFRSLDEMPESMRRHLRYPASLLRTQSDVLEEYHVEDPAEFFAGQNQWQVPSEGGPQGTAGTPNPPVYALVPGADGIVAFHLVTAFIARERPNMTAILLVDNAPETYGHMSLLLMPRDEQVAGPRQVRAIVEQDPTISATLSLWRQSGSDVDIGHIRIVPMDSTILFVMPVFLRSAGSAIPQLQRVVVSDGVQVRMAATLREAMNALAVVESATADPGVLDQPPVVTDSIDWVARALDLVNAADRALRNANLAEFGRHWAELQDLLRRAAARPPR